MEQPALKFMQHFFYSEVWKQTQWMGINTLKCPSDLFLYQEILTKVRPDIIIECGTFQGGSALYFAHICDLLQNGRIITIDSIVQPNRPVHPRITYIQADSGSIHTLMQVKVFIEPTDKVLVILDSDHFSEHVQKELALYHPLVSVGSYIVVEDTICDEVSFEFNNPGPKEAVTKFLEQHDDFEIDTSQHKFHWSFNWNGYLRRIR
ncbi:cephalosporin hydroxylase family protein [Paenibacillus sp. N1-5-1-14]|nr:cephalosporin hydroxylase family protein [Paenibacillus radicibacter]